MDAYTQRLATIGTIGAVWISLGGIIIIAAIHDGSYATQVIAALVALALGSSGSSTAMHIFGSPDSRHSGTLPTTVSVPMAVSASIVPAPPLAAPAASPVAAANDSTAAAVDASLAAGSAGSDAP